MKLFIALLVAALTISFVGTAQAAKEKKGKGLKGQVVSVAADGKSIVVSTGKKSDAKQSTIELDDSCTVTIDGAPGKVADLKAGLYVLVSPAEGKATSITATTAKPEKKA
jgi:hypothetical protein